MRATTERAALPTGSDHSPDQRPPHVLVCVLGQASDQIAIDGGRMLADQLGGRLSVVYAFAPGDAPRRLELARTRAAAAAMGVSLIEAPAYSALDGVVEFAVERGVTHVVMATRPAGRSLLPGRASLESQIAARLDGVDLVVITSWRPRRERAQ